MEDIFKKLGDILDPNNIDHSTVIIDYNTGKNGRISRCYADAFISSAKYENGIPLSDQELDKLKVEDYI